MISSSAKDGSVGSVRKMFTSPTMHCSSSTLASAHRCLSKMMKVHSDRGLKHILHTSGGVREQIYRSNVDWVREEKLDHGV